MRGPRRFSREQLLQSRQRCRLGWNKNMFRAMLSAQCSEFFIRFSSISFGRASMRTRNERQEMPVIVLIVSILIAVRVHVDAKSNKNPPPPFHGDDWPLAVDDRPVRQMPSLPRIPTVTVATFVSSAQALEARAAQWSIRRLNIHEVLASFKFAAWNQVEQFSAKGAEGCGVDSFRDAAPVGRLCWNYYFFLFFFKVHIQSWALPVVYF